jgi:predicted transcriptional regulator
MEQDTEQDRRSEPRASLPREARVREDDLEPFAALRYIARLFKVLAVLVLLLMAAEVTLGFVEAGMAALANLLVESTRLLVFAAFLWAGGDIALMLVETNHDLRATRILVGRLHAEIEQLKDRLRPG